MCLPDGRDLMGGEIARGFHKRATTSACQQVGNNWRAALRCQATINELCDDEFIRTLWCLSPPVEDASAAQQSPGLLKRFNLGAADRAVFYVSRSRRIVGTERVGHQEFWGGVGGGHAPLS